MAFCETLLSGVLLLLLGCCLEFCLASRTPSEYRILPVYTRNLKPGKPVAARMSVCQSIRCKVKAALDGMWGTQGTIAAARWTTADLRI